ncbi:ABC transporter ATP-binding protein [Leptolyngbya sp. DQ-M1]|uniref:ABC transporter ATP-binding protein n=1 Tax=Leptolyngbya sp. DQ-M1 TaxID=2933920 RepID=UPI0032992388
MQDAIIVDNLGKHFNRHHADRPMTLMEAALSGWRRITPIEQFWALRNVSFTVSDGEMLGILGRNGAGKSTLLQLIGGVGSASEGRAKVKGRIGALLDLGAGFHSDLTGRENVFVCGVVAGLTRKEVARRFDVIVAFAELEDFIDNPVRTYSSGMQMRLAFAIAIHTDPDVLLIDEFLSVGDLAFQTKCLARIRELKSQGCAIVYISHSPDQIEKLCDRALWLQQGRMVAYGEPGVVAGQYLADMQSETRKRTPSRPAQFTEAGTELRVNENRFGSLEVEITAVRLLPDSEIRSGDLLQVEIEYWTPCQIESPIFSVSIHLEDSTLCCDFNTKSQQLSIPYIEGQGKLSLSLDRLDLNQGQYFIDVGVYEKDWAYAYDYHWQAYPLLVQTSLKAQGILHPPANWKLQSIHSSHTRSPGKVLR